MNAAPRVCAWSVAAVCVLSSGLGNAEPDAFREQPADSLAAAIDRLEPDDLAAALAWLDAESPGAVAAPENVEHPDAGAGRWRLSLRRTSTADRWDFSRADGTGEIRLRGEGRVAPAGGAALRWGGARVLVGDTGLHAGSGLLLSGAGRWAGLASPGGGRAGIQVGLHAGAAERRVVRGAAAAWRAGPGEILVWQGRAREAGSAPRAGAALAWAGGGGEAALAVATESAGRGGSLSAAWTCGDLGLAGESSVWSARAGGSRRAVWVVAGRWRAGRRATAEVQVAAAQPGPAPRTGQRPAALTSDDGCGWLVRVRGRGDVLTVAAACGVSEHDGWSDGTPRPTAVRRWSLETGGGDARRRWGASLTGRSATQRGWSGRMPWLPAALQSAQDTWRAASWLETGSGAWQGRLGWRTVRTVDRDGAGPDSDDRSAVSLALGVQPPDGWGWRFVQVWAWGGGADLLSVESPAPGLVLPRHWGRWRDERTLGVHWRRGGSRFSASAACRRPQQPQDAATYEIRASAALDWRWW
ncbi:MAG: hypothetical protein Q7W56_09935 [Candidatus Latescibacteria bacterium]|nr:hypothetical protein [Candidatus Latescibacterota bacterium]